TIPSFLLLEPEKTDEPMGAGLIVLGLLGLALIAVGIFRTVAAQMRTSRSLARWLRGADVVGSQGSARIFHTCGEGPAITVAGLRAPKVLVSRQARSVLTDPELRTALRHEMAHVRRRDNLKKLLFRLFSFPGMSVLEREWSLVSEMAADDEAVSSLR